MSKAHAWIPKHEKTVEALPDMSELQAAELEILLRGASGISTCHWGGRPSKVADHHPHKLNAVTKALLPRHHGKV